jgi:hypothetical protein
MGTDPNSAHYSLAGIPTLIGGAILGILLSGQFVFSLVIILILWPLYARLYAAYFSRFAGAPSSERRNATFGFVALQLAFWGLLFVLIRIATIQPTAI